MQGMKNRKGKDWIKTPGKGKGKVDGKMSEGMMRKGEGKQHNSGRYWW